MSEHNPESSNPTSAAYALPRYDTVQTALVGAHVLQVTLARPEVGNAMNTQMGATCSTCGAG